MNYNNIWRLFNVPLVIDPKCLSHIKNLEGFKGLQINSRAIRTQKGEEKYFYKFVGFGTFE